jgi:hypothetical protein
VHFLKKKFQNGWRKPSGKKLSHGATDKYTEGRTVSSFIITKQAEERGKK